MRSRKVVILVSGPPGAGKDTVGGIIEDRFGYCQMKFADPLRKMVQALGFDLSNEVATKDTWVHPVLNITQRQAQIWLSEKVLKPAYGKDIFGRLAHQRISECAGNVVVTDSGFVEEAAPIVATYTTMRIHVTRPGHDYTLDSRSDWDSRSLGIPKVIISNDRSLAELTARCASIMDALEGFTL